MDTPDALKVYEEIKKLYKKGKYNELYKLITGRTKIELKLPEDFYKYKRMFEPTGDRLYPYIYYEVLPYRTRVLVTRNGKYVAIYKYNEPGSIKGKEGNTIVEAVLNLVKELERSGKFTQAKKILDKLWFYVPSEMLEKYEKESDEMRKSLEIERTLGHVFEKRGNNVYETEDRRFILYLGLGIHDLDKIKKIIERKYGKLELFDKVGKYVDKIVPGRGTVKGLSFENGYKLVFYVEGEPENIENFYKLYREKGVEKRGWRGLFIPFHLYTESLRKKYKLSLPELMLLQNGEVVAVFPDEIYKLFRLSNNPLEVYVFKPENGVYKLLLVASDYSIEANEVV